MTQTHTTATAGAPTPGRPPGVDHGDAAYWARIKRIGAQAPPLSDHQRAVIRAAFHQPADQKEQAA